MKDQNKTFVFFLVMTSLLMGGILAENIYSVLFPPAMTIVIDVAKVRAGIEKAGLVPKEAQYWETVNSTE